MFAVRRATLHVHVRSVANFRCLFSLLCFSISFRVRLRTFLCY